MKPSPHPQPLQQAEGARRVAVSGRSGARVAACLQAVAGGCGSCAPICVQQSSLVDGPAGQSSDECSAGAAAKQLTGSSSHAASLRRAWPLTHPLHTHGPAAGVELVRTETTGSIVLHGWAGAACSRVGGGAGWSSGVHAAAHCRGRGPSMQQSKAPSPEGVAAGLDHQPTGPGVWPRPPAEDLQAVGRVPSRS